MGGGSNPVAATISDSLPFRDFQQTYYSRVPNKQTGRLLENEKNSHLYAFIQTYTFINFQQKVPLIRLFPPILLLILYFQSPIL